MSVKAMAAVWDLECPKRVQGLAFGPSHKFVLLAYADHADHEGKNIWPSVETIVRKTGLCDRSVQRLTDDLRTMGFLIPDGRGPRGTNRWLLSVERGDTLSPRNHVTPKSETNPSGDISSGDIPSGDTMSPELKNHEPLNTDSEDEYYRLIEMGFLQLYGWTIWQRVKPMLRAAHFTREEEVLRISHVGAAAEECQERFARAIERFLRVPLKAAVRVEFEA